MRIDVHAHLIPEGLFEPFAERGVQVMGLPQREGESAQITPRQGGDFALEQLHNIERRLRDMERQRVDMHVLSVPPAFFYTRDINEAVELCRLVNDTFADIVAKHPRSFVAIADVPMQAGEEAARELERAVRDLGLRGAEICSQINGMNLDDKSFAPFYAKAQELDVPIFIHPAGVPGLGERLGRYYLTNLIGNPMDTTIAAASLIFGGVLNEFPRLKFYLAHGGGACPYIRYRWDHGWHVREEGKAVIDRPPSEYFKLLYFDSLTHGGPALSFLASTVGADRIMLGTDYPFDMGNCNSVSAIQSTIGVTDAGRELMLGGNAQRLFKIEG
jgi:aminocarboxymuconate-semialdehyde decarboxylase